MGGGADPSEPISGASDDVLVSVNIRCSNGSKFTVRADLGSTVAAFKAAVSQRCEIPADQQRLIYKGRILKDDQTLESYGLQADHTVHVVRGFAALSSANNINVTNNSVSNNSTQVSARAIDSADNGGFGWMGLGGLGGLLLPGVPARGLGGNGTSDLFGTGLPELEQMQWQLTQNPNMMREITNMPVIQNLMGNPDLMHNLIMSNPQMSDIIDRNPDLAHILNDPSILRQTLEAARNPELMREMMRNTDRAMSNIESSPEGFNMLRRMYETVKEPFFNGTAMAGDGGNDSGSNLFAAFLGNLGASQARDGSLNASTTGSETATGSPAPNTNPLPNPWTVGGIQTNNTAAGTASVLDAQSPVTGGLGLPELGQMLRGFTDPSILNQMMRTPAIMQMMQSLLSNPQYMNQILGFNPHLRNLLDSNMQFREMMQNPEFLRQLTSPETLQALLAQLSHQRTNRGQENGGGSGAPNNLNLDLLMSMFGGLGAVPPEQLYATQLSQLQEMGFFDTQENIHTLSVTHGNVNAAVERLLGNLG